MCRPGPNLVVKSRDELETGEMPAGGGEAEVDPVSPPANALDKVIRGFAVLFLVPSIALLSQSLKQWSIEVWVPLRTFAVFGCESGQGRGG